MGSGWDSNAMLELGHRHAELEARRALDPLMATLVENPSYEFHPMGLGMSGGDRVRRYYRQFMDDYMERIVARQGVSDGAEAPDEFDEEVPPLGPVARVDLLEGREQRGVSEVRDPVELSRSLPKARMKPRHGRHRQPRMLFARTSAPIGTTNPGHVFHEQEPAARLVVEATVVEARNPRRNAVSELPIEADLGREALAQTIGATGHRALEDERRGRARSISLVAEAQPGQRSGEGANLFNLDGDYARAGHARQALRCQFGSVRQQTLLPGPASGGAPDTSPADPPSPNGPTDTARW